MLTFGKHKCSSALVLCAARRRIAHATMSSVPKYVPNPKHRNWKPGESQWQITKSEEHDSFRLAWRENWCLDGRGFGLHVVEDGHEKPRAQILGVIEDHKTEVFVAKFVSDPNDQWHGYPADHTKNQDRPARSILNHWLTADLVPPSKIRKIGCGQRCSR